MRLSSAEWWYNTTFHSSLQATPNQIVYGTKPRHLAQQSRNHTNIHSLEEFLVAKQLQWDRLKEVVEIAQHKMKQNADAKR